MRDRVLYGVLGFGCATLLFSLALAELSLHQQQRVVQDIGMASISLCSVMVAIFLGSSLLYKEIERKTLYVILPKPVRRAEFLLGKYFGICLTVAVFIMLMGGLQMWVAALQAGASVAHAALVVLGLGAVLGLATWRATDRTAVLLPWSILALGACSVLITRTDAAFEVMAVQLTLVMGEVLVLSAVALLFSSFSTPFLTGVFTLGVWVMGRSADVMMTIKSKAVGPEVLSMLRGAAEVLPNLHLFVPDTGTLVGDAAHSPWIYTAQSMSYGVVYAALLLGFAAFVFDRRDFL